MFPPNFKDACWMFWRIKGHLEVSETTIWSCYDSYFRRLWHSEDSIEKDGFDEAFELYMERKEMRGHDGVVGAYGTDIIEINVDELKEALQLGVVDVKFKKKDGTERKMSCTLQDGVVPKATKEDPLSQKKIRQISDEVLPVWDLEKEAWRSFRKDSVIEWTTAV